MLIDTHAHLYWEDFQYDFDEVINQSLTAGVGAIINIGVDLQTSKQALRQDFGELSRVAQGKLVEVPRLKFYSSIGIHPHDAIKYSANPDVSIQKDVDTIEEVYKQSLPSPNGEGQKNISKVVLVGECGLDFLFDHHALLETPSGKTISATQAKTLQTQLFQAQVNLARKLNLPLSVHCRDDRSQNPHNCEAWDQVIDITKSYHGIYHCYSGLPKTTQRIIQETNFLVSFAATLTYPKNDYLIEAVKMLPLERVVLETDCPFLPPQSKRGTRNEPAAVLEIAQKVAEIKGISVEKVAEQTTQNALKLLHLDI